MTDDEKPGRSLHTIRIEMHGSVLLTRVFLDGEELRGVIAVRTHLDVRDRDHRALVTLVLAPRDIEIVGDEVNVLTEPDTSEL